MVIIQCKCGVKYEIRIPDDYNVYPSCPSCKDELPGDIVNYLSTLYRGVERSEYKVFFDAGNMFNAQLTLQISPERLEPLAPNEVSRNTDSFSFSKIDTIDLTIAAFC